MYSTNNHVNSNQLRVQREHVINNLSPQGFQLLQLTPYFVEHSWSKNLTVVHMAPCRGGATHLLCQPPTPLVQPYSGGSRATRLHHPCVFKCSQLRATTGGAVVGEWLIIIIVISKQQFIISWRIKKLIILLTAESIPVSVCMITTIQLVKLRHIACSIVSLPWVTLEKHSDELSSLIRWNRQGKLV